MRKLTFLAAIFVLLPAISQAKTLEDLLVEKGVITKSEARASMHDGHAKVYWNNGTRLEFPDHGFTAQVNTLLQTRYTYTDNDDGIDNTSSFDVRRARLILSGNALHNEFSYRLEAGFAADQFTPGGDADGTADPMLLDAWIEWHACDWMDLRMGQFKVALSRQENTENYGLQFADRSVASDYFALRRHQGARATLSTDDDKYYLFGGVYNGESLGEGINRSGVDTSHTAEVGVRANLMGEMNPFIEGDIEMSEDMAINGGVTYTFSDSEDPSLGTTDMKHHRLSADVNVKSNGISFHGEFFWSNLDDDTLLIDTEPLGFYAQLGFHVSEDVELAARYSMVDCDNGMGSGDCAGNDDISQISAGVNYYFWKHNMKAQFGWDHMDYDPVGGGSSTDMNRWIFQLSAYL